MFPKKLKALAPNGVDVVYDNVEGRVLDVMLARLVMCGGISRYEHGGTIVGPANYFNLILRRATMGGSIVLDHEAEWPAIRERLAALALARQLKWQLDVLEGLENAPAALARPQEGFAA